MNERDVFFLPLTHSLELYGSRLEEMNQNTAPIRNSMPCAISAVTSKASAATRCANLATTNASNFTISNISPGSNSGSSSADDLRRLWDPDFWTEMFAQVDAWDRQIEAFNQAAASA